jgi:hypothetical protein
MATNGAVADSAKSSATGSPAPGQEVNNNTGGTEPAGGENKVKSEKERMIPTETSPCLI